MKTKNIQNKKLVLSFSGGMDSSVLLFMAAEKGYKEIHTVSFDYGQRHKKELQCISFQNWNLLDKYPDVKFTNKKIDVSYIKDIAFTSSLTNLNINNPDINRVAGEAQPVSYVPFRNQMFISICCSYAESLGVDTVWYGAAQIDSAAGYWDCSEEFVDNLNNVLSLNRNNRIFLQAPLLTMSKKDIVLKGLELGVKFEDTWTCYSNREDELADATTPSSSLRLKGFIEAGYKDPIKYVQQEAIEELYTLNNCKDYKP